MYALADGIRAKEIKSLRSNGLHLREEDSWIRQSLNREEEREREREHSLKGEFHFDNHFIR